MVLSDQEILMEIQSNRLVFTPALTLDQISPSSVDLTLANSFTELMAPNIAGVTTNIDLAKMTNVEQIASEHGKTTRIDNNERFHLQPKSFVLAYTQEHVKLPNYLAARVEGRSSFARLGLSIHQTAPTVHATWEGPLRLEILNSGPFPISLTPGIKICQLILERLGSPAVSDLESLFKQPPPNQ
jgi:dCTP deaminase